MVSIRPVYILGVIVVLLAGCGGRVAAPVDEKGRSLRASTTPYRTVVAGDTLYSIAWEIGKDYRQLAVWNQIHSPYTILPGQRLRLTPTSSLARKPQTGLRYHVVRKGDTLYSIAREAGVDYRTLAARNDIRAPYTLRPGQRLKLQSKSDFSVERPGSKKARKTRRSATKKTNIPRGKVRWKWPIKGKILRRYNARAGNKGLDIAGKRGQSIRAAGAGRVVYQGSGLRGYGNLVIIKHNEEFLSAYAHCDRIYVKEGDVIKQNQQIAKIGSSGTNRTKLHFEIRYRGNPVDPLRYLPKR